MGQDEDLVVLLIAGDEEPQQFPVSLLSLQKQLPHRLVHPASIEAAEVAQQGLPGGLRSGRALRLEIRQERRELLLPGAKGFELRRCRDLAR